MAPSSDAHPLEEVKAMQADISFDVSRPSCEYELPDDFAFTMDSVMEEIEATDPSDLRKLEPSDDWDDGGCTEPPEEDDGL